jgi:amino-acid N-acetyltransferase
MEVRPATARDEAAVRALLAGFDGLEVDFLASEVVVALQDGRLVGCGRLKRHPDGSLELASVATARDVQGQGVGSAVTRALLARARGRVYALALASDFFARHGFRETPKETLPPPILAKADGMCSSRPFKPMFK